MNFERGNNVKDTLEIGRRKEAIHIRKIMIQGTLVEDRMKMDPWSSKMEPFLCTRSINPVQIPVSDMRRFLEELEKNKLDMDTMYGNIKRLAGLEKGQTVLLDFIFHQEYPLMKIDDFFGHPKEIDLNNIREKGIIWMDDFFWIPKDDKRNPMRKIIIGEYEL